MSDDNMFSHYETTEMKMSGSEDYHSGKKQLSKSSPDNKRSKNGLYYHEPNGSKSFGVGTMLLILLVMVIGITIALTTQEEYPLVGIISCIGSLAIVFCVILGGKKPQD